MKQCTGLWIVAPITRAVDDKAAKSLLGDSFKRQLKLDGTYGNVTFICSKTDDISNQEAVQSLDLNETAEKSWQEADEMRNQVKELKDQLNEHGDAKQAYNDAIDDCDDQLETWEQLRDDIQDGKTVYAPTSAKKRKRSSTKSRPQKKRRTTDSDDDYAEDVSVPQTTTLQRSTQRTNPRIDKSLPAKKLIQRYKNFDPSKGMRRLSVNQ